MTRALYPLVAGVLATAFAAIALFFLRFHRSTHERLFAWFALAFALLASERIAGGIAIATGSADSTIWVYLLRLLAFLVILTAIVDKNLRSDAAEGDERST